MFNYKGIKGRKKFDMDADWLPPKDRVFTPKTAKQEEEQKPDVTPPPKDRVFTPKTAKQEEVFTPKTDVTPPRDLSFALKGPRLSNAELFERAYEAPGSVYIYGDTRVVASTKGTPLISKDWMQNYKYLGIPWITGKPVQTEKTDRAKDNERARAAAPYTKNTIGHSLGGSVVIAEKQKYGDTKGIVYSTPYDDYYGTQAIRNWFFHDLLEIPNKSGETDNDFERKRSFLDPVGMFDNSAKTSWHTHPWDFMSFTHDYHDLAKDDYTADPTEAYGSKNADGSITLRE